VTIVGKAYIEIRADDRLLAGDVKAAATAAIKATKGVAVSVTADADQLDASVVAAAKAAARKATKELAAIPGGVEPEAFKAQVAAAAKAAADRAKTELANIPVDLDVENLGREAARGAQAIPREIDQAMDAAERRVQTGANRMRDDTNTAMRGLSSGVARGFAAIGGAALITSAVGEVREANKVQAQTAAAIRSTGGAANLTARDVARLASSIEDATAVEDDNVQAGANLLLTFTNIKEEVKGGRGVFSEATRVLVDMAAAMGNDVSSGAIQLGKALNDPVAGVSALAEVGVTFTDQQKAQIAAMVQAGDTAEAQRVILAELRKEFGGSAAAQADSVDRQLRKWDELQERVGGAVLGIAGAVGALPGPVQAVGASLGGLALAAVVVANVADAVGSLADRVRSVDTGRLQTIGRGVQNLAIGGAAVAAGVAGFDLLADAVQRLTLGPAPKLSALERDLVQFGTSGRVSGELARNFGTDLDSLAGKLDKLDDKGGGALRFFDPFGLLVKEPERRDVMEDLEALDTALTNLVRRGEAGLARSVLTDLADQAGLSEAQVRPFLENYAEALAGLQTEARLAVGTAKDLTAAQGPLASALAGTGTAMDANVLRPMAEGATAAEKAANALDTFKDALDRALGVQIDAERAAVAYVESVHTLATTLHEGGDSLDLNTEAGRRNRLAILDAVESAKAHVQAMADQGATAETLRGTWQTHRGELEKVLAQAGLTKGEISSYLGLLDQVKPTVFTQLGVEKKQAEADLDAFARKLRETTTNVLATIGIGVEFRSQGSLGSREYGGAVYPGQTYTTGERRPEWYQPAGGGPGQMLGVGGPQLFRPPATGWVYPRVPSAASGAIVQPTPGGTLVQVAEAGRAEALIPLPDGLVSALERIASGGGAGGGMFRDLVVQGADLRDTYRTGAAVVAELRAEHQRRTGGKLWP
jgi:hypothetical protein